MPFCNCGKSQLMSVNIMPVVCSWLKLLDSISVNMTGN